MFWFLSPVQEAETLRRLRLGAAGGVSVGAASPAPRDLKNPSESQIFLCLSKLYRFHNSLPNPATQQPERPQDKSRQVAAGRARV